MTCDSHRAAAPVAALRAFAWVLALALAAAGANAAAQDERNEPAAPAQTTMPALPPAVIDETLAIGGEEIEARKVRFQLRKCERNTVRIRTSPGYASRLSADRETACSG